MRYTDNDIDDLLAILKKQQITRLCVPEPIQVYRGGTEKVNPILYTYTPPIKTYFSLVYPDKFFIVDREKKEGEYKINANNVRKIQEFLDIFAAHIEKVPIPKFYSSAETKRTYEAANAIRIGMLNTLRRCDLNNDKTTDASLKSVIRIIVDQIGFLKGGDEFGKLMNKLLATHYNEYYEQYLVVDKFKFNIASPTKKS